jgi:S1-C subfamily serine protease
MYFSISKFIIALLAAISLSSCVQEESGIVTIYDLKPRGMIGCGTGFVAAKSKNTGYVITARHLLANATNFMVYFGNDQLIGSIVGTDKKTDVAVLVVHSIPENAQVLEFADFRTAKVGDPVTEIGNANGDGLVTTDGTITSVKELFDVDPMTCFLFNAKSETGDSGAPLLNNSGDVIGLVDSYWADPPHPVDHYRVLAIPSNDVQRAFLQIMKGRARMDRLHGDSTANAP